MIGGVWGPSSDMPWDVGFAISLRETLAAFKGLETVTLINTRHEEGEREVQILNRTCPYECWEWHEDSNKTACLRDQNPEFADLQEYVDALYDFRPPGLDRWPVFSFSTMVPSWAEPGVPLMREEMV